MRCRKLLKRKTYMAVVMAAVLALSGCGKGEGGNLGASAENAEAIVETVSEVVPIDPKEIFSDRDFETDYDESKSVQITFVGKAVECSSDNVEIAGSTVTIRKEGTYILRGSLDDGMVIVDGDKEEKIQLVLAGVNLHSSAGAPIYVKQSDKVFLTLANGSENRLSGGESLADEDVDAVIFSKEDLTINGEGALTIHSPGGHGVVSKDELTVTGGVFDITSASHGLSGKDGVGIAGGTFQITAGKDGIHGENKDDASLGYVYVQNGTFAIRTEDDGISAAANMQIDGGTFQVDAGDDGFHADDTLTIMGGVIDITESYEGLEGLHVVVSGGEITLVARDDGLNAAGGMDASGFGGRGGKDMFGRGGERFGAGKEQMPDNGSQKQPGERPMKPENMPEMPENMPEMPENMPMMSGGSSEGSITITGGNLSIKAFGDGIDANGSLHISGGNIQICGPNHGDTATLDYDTTGVITGGTFIGTGATGMAQTFSDSEQGVVMKRVGATDAGTKVTLKDKTGGILLNCTPEMDFSMVILSSPGLVTGEKYTLTVGGSSYELTIE